ncbi:TIGR04141 family sporadically distributed protein [Natronoglycomyces albus]|uniref:TIGR04141 family sporadically distributed protein n=1 Tax=Natronoglycomyces albus TaxID=2811108 RepID=A0A895XNN4_9ACTN|nr:DUF6119 family protein [Natronoglycomyces albus]QSB05153.1 TIGR04141 family sporadically distributed protein [Natronoglycomyces albus]
MFEALGDERIDKLIERGADYSNTEVAGCPALVVFGQGDECKPSWLNNARKTTGLPLDLTTQNSFALLLIAVDGTVYGLGYGTGYHLIPSEYKDARFGLSFAARVADPERVRDLVRRRPGQRGRVDGTWAAGGIPVWLIGVDQQSDVIDRLGATTTGLDLTASRNGSGDIRIQGGIGLRARFGVAPEDLVHDIRTIAAIINEKAPIAELAFVDHMAVVNDTTRREWLDANLESILSSTETACRDLAIAIPEECLDDYHQARSTEIRIGSAPAKPVTEVTMEAIATRASVQKEGTRVASLRKGRIQLYTDQLQRDRLSHSNALKWIEATVSLDERRYHLLDGEWLEFDGAYADSQDGLIEELLAGSSDIELPAWKDGWKEEDYLHFAAIRTQMPCLDRKLISISGGRKFEACDLLGPDNELIHVKQGGSSKPLSHLFNQGLVSAAELQHSSEARKKFSELVQVHGNGRAIPLDFVPSKVVYAFRCTDGRTLSASTLYPFSKVTLGSSARRLRDMGIEVKLIGIDTVAE